MNILCFSIPYLLPNYRYEAVFRFAGAVVALAFEYRSATSTSGRVENHVEVLNPAVACTSCSGGSRKYERGVPNYDRAALLVKVARSAKFLRLRPLPVTRD